MLRINFKKIFAACVVLAFISLIFGLKIVDIRNSIPEPEHDRAIQELEIKIQKLDNELLSNSIILKKLNDRLKSKTLDSQLAKLDKTVLPILVIACNRPSVNRCLDNLIKYRPNKEMFPIIVSQDCGHKETYRVIKNYTDHDSSISVVQQPDLTEIKLPKTKEKFAGYYKIARHFKFALGHVFNVLRHEAVIIVEDDLDISPDFFEYFLGTYPLLLTDPSLWCVSAWNDNGKPDLIDLSRNDLLHRTDFFPGLGWMTTKDMWTKLEPKWPTAFFDDWLRDQKNVDGRACIRPEVSRTYSFGKVGVSKGLFFDMHLKYIQLNNDFVPFTKLNLTYLLQTNYDKALTTLVKSLPKVKPKDVAIVSHKAVRVGYKDARSYRRAAKLLGLMDDFRSGIPRTAYMGIVTCYKNGKRVYLVPDFDWTGYNPNWT